MILTNVINPRQTEKAIMLCLEAKDGHLTKIWLPKSHTKLEGTTLTVEDWIYKSCGFENLISRGWQPYEFYIHSAPVEKISIVADGTYEVKLPNKTKVKLRIKTPDRGYPMIGYKIGRTCKFFGSVEGTQIRFWDKFLKEDRFGQQDELRQAWQTLKNKIVLDN